MLSWLRGTTEPIYTPTNPDHIAHVREVLSQFLQSREDLMKLDRTLGVAVGADSLLWLGGFFGGALSLVGLIAIYIYAQKYAMRQQLEDHFREELTRLVNIYEWCAKNNSATITQDNTFLDVLEAIAPHISSSKQLIKWDLTHTNPDDLSDRFTKIMAQSPHRIQFVMMKKGEVSYTMAEALDAAIHRAVSDPSLGMPARIISKAKSWGRFFDQTRSEANLALYGYEPDAKERPALPAP